jgi:transposase
MAEPLLFNEQLLSDELWNQIQPLLPKHSPDPRGGAPRKSDRACLEGILYVLVTGCQWRMVPHDQLRPSGVTCWRRFTEWTRAGIWTQLHRRLLNCLGIAGAVDLDRILVDSGTVRAKKGAPTADPAL